MTVIVGFKELRQERQVTFERKVLRELSLEALKERLKEYFGSGLLDVMEEGCCDIAIEAFLLGASYSKFGYYGESEEKARARCWREEKQLIDSLFNFLLSWGPGMPDEEGLFYRCEAFVSVWWKDGFKTGEKRFKMRLH
ncbi:DUF2521 family protein [Bacillus massiliglaciei]|uniref:DUF2521 family protein n=1 Tax=Bacillus massiliglaciei TaxID=1816693 RepID=UPI000B17D99E|nr:DUF2521 family protein [Bacillus massiliglaciei]